MEYGTLERDIRIDASPATVFEVITSPDHLAQWWPDEATLDPTPGGTGELVFGVRGAPDAHMPQVMVVDAVPNRHFSFRWTHAAGETADATNSLLVSFDLTPDGTGTLLHMTETGFRERGWEVAVLEETYRDHESGWDHFLPRLAGYAPTVEAAA